MFPSEIENHNTEEFAIQRLVAIIESSDDAIISKSLEGIILSWNKGAERIFGYTEHEILGQNIIILIPEHLHEEEKRILNQIKNGKRIEHYETLRKCKDGKIVNISLSVSPIKNTIGEVIGASKIARDITERKQIEYSQMRQDERLSQERNQLRTLIDNIPAYIYFKDTESRFIDANKATVQVMKCKNIEELLGKTDFDFYPPEFAAKYFADEFEIIKTGKPKLDIEETLLLNDNKTTIISTSKVPLVDSAGNIVGLVGIGRDITEQKKAREVLERDKETLEKIVQERTKELLRIQSEIDQAKRLSDIGALAAIVGHELRNPLGVIKMAIHNLKKEKEWSENKHLINIEKKLWEGNLIIDNLLNYSRIKVPVYETINLHSLVDDCVSCSQDTSEKNQIIIEKKYGLSPSTTIEIDPYQIKEVFINILINAAQALPLKKGKIEVILQARGEKDIEVIVKDNGVGIDEKDLNKIFTPFYTSKSRGTGLGLAICKELVDLHHGKIEVQSQKGQGTTVRVILPARKP